MSLEIFDIYENKQKIQYVGCAIYNLDNVKELLNNQGYKEFIKEIKPIKWYSKDNVTSYQNEKYQIDIFIVTHEQNEIEILLDIYVNGSNKIHNSQYHEIIKYFRENIK